MGLNAGRVLTEEDLNETDTRVLEIIRRGRVTPQYLAETLDISRTYASERLKRFVEHGHVEKLAAGLYELVDDPRGDGEPTDETELRGRLQDALEARDDAQARADRLAEELEDCREQLEGARETAVDLGQLERALGDAEAAFERGDGQALQEALQRAGEAIEDT